MTSKKSCWGRKDAKFWRKCGERILSGNHNLNNVRTISRTFFTPRERERVNDLILSDMKYVIIILILHLLSIDCSMIDTPRKVVSVLVCVEMTGGNESKHVGAGLCVHEVDK